MIWFVLGRLGAFLGTVLATTLLAYWLLLSAPHAGDVGLLRWLGLLLTGDFGSGAAGPIGPLLAARLAVTLPLALFAAIIALVVGGLLGYDAAHRPDALLDRTIRALAGLGLAAPAFWLGMMLVVVFANAWHWLPPGGFVPWQQSPGAALMSLILPAIALAVPTAAALALAARDAVAATRRSGWFETALARGETVQAAMRRQGLRAVAHALLRPAAKHVAALIVGTVVIESVFYLPGLGRMLLDAVAARDVATARATIVTLVLLTAGTMFLIRLLALWLDPRLRARMPE